MRQDIYLIQEEPDAADACGVLLEFRNGGSLLVFERVDLGPNPVEEDKELECEGVGPIDRAMFLAGRPGSWLGRNKRPVVEEPDYFARIRRLRPPELWEEVSRIRRFMIEDGWDSLTTQLDTSWIAEEDWVIARIRHESGRATSRDVLLR